MEESLRGYVAKFNMVALEMPSVDAKIKIHAFIQGLWSGPFIDSLVMSVKPKDFKDLLRRITPYIHLEEARVAKREETKRREKKSSRRREEENKIEE